MKKLLIPVLLISLSFSACKGGHDINEESNNSGGSAKSAAPIIDSSKAIGVGINGGSSNTEGYSDTSTTKNPLIDSAKKKKP